MPYLWKDPIDVMVPEKLADIVGGHPLVAATLVRRGITDPQKAQEFLEPEYYFPTHAEELPGIEKATMRIKTAIDMGETILVWGDFDVDGQTSTTLLVEALEELGAKVKYHIPIRATEGHGIRVEILEMILQNNPDIGVMLTCDTGIAAHNAVNLANANGINVVITDHHDLLQELPLAYAIVDPKMLPNQHPLASLPGVGVAYKLIEALFELQQPKFKSELTTEKYLDLVALGIVADVAEQRGDTRYLLQRGLQKLRNTQRLGLLTLMELAQIIPNSLDEGQIGFGIGPRLNALGRLSDANPIVEFLTTNEAPRARVMATQLEGLNERRKLLTEQIFQAALAQIEQNPPFLQQSALILAHPGWHTGVIGIVASRLVERFRKPAIMLSIGDDGIARGSARSIEGVHITEAIATQKDLLINFGGHPGAAGLSIPESEIGQFRRGLGKAVRSQIGDQTPEPVIQLDGYLSISELSLKLVDEIGKLGPFGAGNPHLTLASPNLTLVSHTQIGRKKEHLRLVVSDEAGTHQNVLWWNGVSSQLPQSEIPFDLAYSLQATTFRGERQLQIQWVDFRYLGEPPQVTLIKPTLPEIVDFRREANPLALLKSIQAEHDVQIWAEGEGKSRTGGVDRTELKPGGFLVVWTTPPGPKELLCVLELIRPEKVFIFAANPKVDEVKSFLSRLAGLAKFAIERKEGMVDFENFAAATSHRVGSIKMGLYWMQAKGYIEILRNENEDYILNKGKGEETSDIREVSNELGSMLKETAAYRKYFQTAKDSLTLIPHVL